MGRHLVLAGGGHAHLLSLANLRRFTEQGHRVTVIAPSETHWYSGMGPGLLGGLYTPEMIRFQTRQTVENNGGTFVPDAVLRIDPAGKTLFLQSGESMSYDLVSFNTGSHVPNPFFHELPPDVFPVKPIAGLLQARDRLLKLIAEQDIRVAVVGGGPAGAEIAGNVHRLLQDRTRHQATIRIFAGQKFMPRFAEPVRSRVRASLARRGIHILEEGYVKDLQQGQLILESGFHYEMDLCFLALGVKPSPIFKHSGLPVASDGGLLVNSFLQSPDYPDIFGGGDCVAFQKRPLDKVGVYAVRQNPVLFSNLLARLEGAPLQTFDPGGDYLLVFNLGDGTGVFQKKSLVFNGRAAFRIKDWIDRRFMNKFQRQG